MIAQATDDAVNIAQNVGFGVIAVGMIVAALGVVSTRNVVHAALWLVLVLSGVAAQVRESASSAREGAVSSSRTASVSAAEPSTTPPSPGESAAATSTRPGTPPTVVR